MEKNLYHLAQANNPICYSPLQEFCQIYKEIIAQSYKIFPVPSKFINSILDFILQNKILVERKYSCKSILKKYTKNWRYYSVFRFNLERMLQKSYSASITVIKFNTEEELNFILNKYKPIELQFQINTNTNAAIYSYTQKFDLILLVNERNKIKFEYFKAIQHELIHWMQVVLNAQSYTERGIFKPLQNSITNEQIWFLSDAFNYKKEIINTINYVLNEIEFQPWCANAVEDFEYLKLNLNAFENIIKNPQLFKETCKKFNNNEYMIELLLFSEICYLASQNNPADDRYWYLIESIKNNK